MKKTHTHKRKPPFILILLGIGVLSIIGGYYYYSSSKISRILPAQILEKAQQYFSERDTQCPILALKSESLIQPSDAYKIVNVSCDYDNEQTLGYDQATVEIYTQNQEDGQKQFEEFLTNHNLKESNKLRITYLHKSN